MPTATDARACRAVMQAARTRRESVQAPDPPQERIDLYAGSGGHMSFNSLIMAFVASMSA